MVIVVSHDRDFLQGLTDELYEFRDGAVHEFKGDIMEFMEADAARRAAEEREKLAQQKVAVAASPSAGREAYAQRQERERERRKLQNIVAKKEEEVLAIEQQIAERDALLATGQAQTSEFYSEYQSLKEQLEQKMQEWEDAVIQAEE